MEFKTLKEASEAYEKLLAANGAQSAELNTLQGTVKSQHEILEEQSHEIEELHILISELRNAKPVFGRAGFIYNGDRFEITASTVNYKGKELTAVDIMNDKDLQAELIGIGAGFIVKKTDEE